ncbi:hypothetical protein [Kitasatospora sp. NPDC098663]|uniref:hypothetical protein n=1 Tax=Kitasatospora sp. NPDC098663 TaxID=3364096 RepID=UPI00382ED92F
MNIGDLEWQSTYHDGPLRMVRALLEQGHVDLVVGAAREREDWFWAKAAVDALCAAGEFEQAMELVQPFAEAGWQPAVWKSAHILVGWGRVEEGLALVRPDEREQEDEWKCHDFAELLVKAGRVERRSRSSNH